MGLFRKINSQKIKDDLMQKEAASRAAMFVFGCLIAALAYNLFYVPYDLVGGGLGGVEFIINERTGIAPSDVIIYGNAILIIVSILALGLKDSVVSIVGAVVYTAFVYFTKDVTGLINFSFDNKLLYVLAAGVVGGFGEGLVYKSGFNIGSISVLATIIGHYRKQPMGYLLRVISIIIILLGAFTFGYSSLMYSIIIVVISTYLIDKIIIGISDSKTFFIQTDRKDEVTDFIINIIGSGVTELDSHGAYSHKRKKMIMCVVPSERYTLLRSAVKEIDPEAFIVVSDCYEVLGGKRRKKLPFGEY